jgi:virulence-associated protein VagC
MNAPVKTSAFKSGNSVAVRLPKAFGIRVGDALEIKRNGTWIEIRPTRSPEEERARFAEMVRRLRELGSVEGGDPEDGRIEFPDRPRLY